jgi:hypothetical protein
LLTVCTQLEAALTAAALPNIMLARPGYVRNGGAYYVEEDAFGFGCDRIPILSTPADAARRGCFKAAKAQSPADRKALKQFRHWCEDQSKSYKAAHKGALKT